MLKQTRSIYYALFSVNPGKYIGLNRIRFKIPDSNVKAEIILLLLIPDFLFRHKVVSSPHFGI